MDVFLFYVGHICTSTKHDLLHGRISHQIWLAMVGWAIGFGWNLDRPPDFVGRATELRWLDHWMWLDGQLDLAGWATKLGNWTTGLGWMSHQESQDISLSGWVSPLSMAGWPNEHGLGR